MTFGCEFLVDFSANFEELTFSNVSIDSLIRISRLSRFCCFFLASSCFLLGFGGCMVVVRPYTILSLKSRDIKHILI